MGSLFDRPGVLIVALVAIIVIFGSKRLPDAARGIGRSLRIFKAETKGLITDDETAQPVPGQAQLRNKIDAADTGADDRDRAHAITPDWRKVPSVSLS